MKVWILTDDRTGSNNQSIAVGESLSTDCVVKKISYNFFVKLPNFIRKDTLIGVNKKESSDIENDLPDVVVCAGRRLSSVALYIKKLSKGKTFVINILNPNLPYNKFNLILLPFHDNTPKKYLEKGNIVETYGSLNRVNKQKIESETEKFKPLIDKYKKPLISFIIGGDTKDYKYNPRDFGKITKGLSNITNKLSGSLLITTSRRTSAGCIEEIKNNLDCNNYFYDWAWENNPDNNAKSELGNPYFAMLGSADFLVVTGDSISMVSEACSTGKPVYVYMPKDILSKKHYRFCKKLLDDGYIEEFNENTTDFEVYSYKPLNEVERLNKIILKKIKEQHDL